jgi:hypothetical protein
VSRREVVARDLLKHTSTAGVRNELHEIAMHFSAIVSVFIATNSLIDAKVQMFALLDEIHP